MSNKIITRFAPSPTGFLHVGGLRTALYNYLFAKKNNGQFLLRIEDTDQSRKVPGAVENLLSTLNSVGLNYDNKKPLVQSERLKIYQAHAQKLVDESKAYFCFCAEERLETLRKVQQQKKQPTRYDGKCRHLSAAEIKKLLQAKTPYVIRQKMPARKLIEFTDLVRGKISINSDVLDDQILLKSDGFPTYHLAVVIDDHDMKITHVIRGEEWLPSTPKHLLLYEAFGWLPPKFAHLPLLLNPDKSKLSKRQGDVAAEDYLAKGYLPEAILNFILLLGWNPGTNKEIFSMDEMIKEFSLEKINKAGAIFNLEKLDWLNGCYIRQLKLDDLVALSLRYLLAAKTITPKTDKNKIKAVVALEQERLKKLSDLPELVAYFFKDIKYDPELLVWKKQTRKTTAENLKKIVDFLEHIAESRYNKKDLETEIIKFIKQNNLGVGDILWPMRVSLCGQKNSPSPFEIAAVFGKKETLRRINTAIKMLS